MQTTEWLNPARMKAIFDSALSGIITIDQRGTIASFNAAAERMFGYPADEVIGRNIKLLMPPHYREEHDGYLAAYLNTGQAKVIGVGRDVTGLRKDGTTFPLNIGISEFHEGDRRFFTGILLDITERKQAEEALRASEERLSLVLEAAEIGTWDWDIRADHFYCSSRCLALFGLPPDAPMDYGRLMELLHEEDRKPVAQSISAAIKGHKDFQTEMRTVWPDGSLHWVASRGRVYYDDLGQPLHMGGAAMDLTEHKRVEQQLRERQSEAENQMRLCVANQTIAAIAHELNQPLNAIASYSAGALRLIEAGNPPLDKLAHAFEQNAKQSLRAGQVIRELLGLLRGNESFTEPFDLNQVVRETVIHNKTDGLLGGFKTTLGLAESLPPVQANRIQVEKVLNNLLRNAVEAMSAAGFKGEEIWVGICTAGQDGFARVTVRDSGPGLTEDSIPRVFEPFFTTKPHGLGMGLAISRSLIEAQGGELWAERNAGPGTSFHFTLPFAAEVSA